MLMSSEVLGTPFDRSNPDATGWIWIAGTVKL
jgi:hypothetical protein